MQFNVLGALEVFDNQWVLTPRTPKMRTVLALLLIRSNLTVSTDMLIQELWGEKPPTSATATLQTYIYLLRKMLYGGAAGRSGDALVTRSPGYMLSLQPEQLDANRFDQLSRRGREALASRDPQRASALLHEALGLWRGRALANVELGPQLDAHVARLEEGKLVALEQRIEADLLLGRHRELIGELKALTTAHPLHEWFHIQLMVALCRSGRRYEALEVYHLLRLFLREELGLDPSLELQQLQRAILAGELPQCGGMLTAAGR